MIKLVICCALIFYVFSCIKVPKYDSHFWYPIALKSVDCGGFKGEVYVMVNSKGWRTWAYTLDRSDKVEIELPMACVFKTIRVMPKYTANSESNIRDQLNKEQREFVVEGF